MKFIYEKIKKDEITGCWEYTGYIRPNGYGRINRKGVTHYVHRYVYSNTIGYIPDGMDVCHKCDNRKCCNPEHLFVGTRADNMMDAVKKGRQAKGEKLAVHHIGEKSPFSKLYSPQVIIIRGMADLGINKKDLSKAFGVSIDNIRKIISRNIWRHI